MPFDEFKQKIKLVIDIKFEIIKIYDLNDEMIDENEWKIYGIIRNKPRIENKLNKEWKHKELMLMLNEKHKQNNELNDVVNKERKEKMELNEINNRLMGELEKSNDRINELIIKQNKEKELLLKRNYYVMRQLDKQKNKEKKEWNDKINALMNDKQSIKNELYNWINKGKEIDKQRKEIDKQREKIDKQRKEIELNELNKQRKEMEKNKELTLLMDNKERKKKNEISNGVDLNFHEILNLVLVMALAYAFITSILL
eukprot:485433_1